MTASLYQSASTASAALVVAATPAVAVIPAAAATPAVAAALAVTAAPAAGKAPVAATVPAAPEKLKSFIWRASQVVVEIPFAAHAPPQSEYVGGRSLRVEHDVVVAAPPYIPLLAQQVVHLIGLVGIELQCGDVEVQLAGLPLMRVEIHH